MEYCIDTHLHTAYSNYIENLPATPLEQVIQIASRLLGGALKTDHDTMAGTAKWLDLAARYGLITSPAVEITTQIPASSRHPHIVAVFPEHRPNQSLPIHQDPLTTLKTLRDMGAFIIAPHPVESVERSLRQRSELSLTHDEIFNRYREYFDAVEVATILGFSKVLLDMVQSADMLPLGASDAHLPQQIGAVHTKFYEEYSTVYEALQHAKHHPGSTEVISNVQWSLFAKMAPTAAFRLVQKFLYMTPQPTLEPSGD